jgi:hypothetical protein
MKERNDACSKISSDRSEVQYGGKGNESAIEKSVGALVTWHRLVSSGCLPRVEWTCGPSMVDHTKRIKCMDGVSFSIMILIGLDGCCTCFIFTYGRPCLEANIQHRLTG